MEFKPRQPLSARPTARVRKMYEDAVRGILPPDPTKQFDTFPTHAAYRNGLAEVMGMIRRLDLSALEAHRWPGKPHSSGIIVERVRDCAINALHARKRMIGSLSTAQLRELLAPRDESMLDRPSLELLALQIWAKIELEVLAKSLSI